MDKKELERRQRKGSEGEFIWGLSQRDPFGRELI